MDTPLCQTIMDTLKAYKIVVKRKNAVIGDGIESIVNLTLADFGESPHYTEYTISVFSHNDKKLGTMMISLDKSWNRETRKTRLAVYIHFVRSFTKGMGKNLIYLMTCKAAEIGLPIAFEAQPSIQDKFPPGTSEELIREKEEKLLQYYDYLGFDRNGKEDYSEEYGLTQHYESLPKNVLSRAVILCDVMRIKGDF